MNAGLLGSWRRRLLGQNTDLLEVTVFLDLLPLHRLLLLGENVFLTHANLEALLEPTALAETTVRQIHLALLVVRTLEVALRHQTTNKSAAQRQYQAPI